VTVWEKEPPSAVAHAVVDALQNGTEDVFLDAMCKELYDAWKADAKALETKNTVG
jgi:hypothetical protein